jgi:hypothetical protein
VSGAVAEGDRLADPSGARHAIGVKVDALAGLAAPHAAATAMFTTNAKRRDRASRHAVAPTRHLNELP